MTSQEYNHELLSFIEQSPTSFHVIENQKNIQLQNGYQQLDESQTWTLSAGGKYFVTRNDSTLAAFRIPESEFHGYMIMASHSDSPALKIKKNPEMKVADEYIKLNTEAYGGLLMGPWLDRPLSVAGRIVLRSENGFFVQLVNIDRDLLVIPSLAIHMNRSANKGYEFNVQKDLLPLYGDADSCSLIELIAKEAGVNADDIIDSDLFLYNREKGCTFGASDEFLLSPRLDDVQCAFSSLQGFLGSEDIMNTAVPVHIVFDNEEVGSSTRQGAASTFLSDLLTRISESLGETRNTHLAHLSQSFMLSADNAHALHPNHTDKSDPVNKPVLNGGVVLKHSANQKYTTDAVSASIVRLLAEKAEISLQEFHNRSDIPGGSTLGNISCNQVAVCTADVGIAQLAMHSICETCGAKDTEDLIKLATALFSAALEKSDDAYQLSF